MWARVFWTFLLVAVVSIVFDIVVETFGPTKALFVLGIALLLTGMVILGIHLLTK